MEVWKDGREMEGWKGGSRIEGGRGMDGWMGMDVGKDGRMEGWKDVFV